MNLQLYKFYDGMGPASVLIALSIMFLAGFLLSRVSKLFKLPNVTGYILSGILIGPFVLDLVSPEIIDGMSFLSDLALGFIAFGVGKFFKKDVLKRSGPRVIVITLLEAMVAGVLVAVFVGISFPSLGWGFALLLGAIATATAPASTLMTINQYDAKGEFVDVLLQVVALDDVVCLLCFSAASAVVEGTSSGNLDALSIFMPILYNLLFLVIGFVSGLFLSFLVKGRSPNSRLIIAVAIIALISGGAGAGKLILAICGLCGASVLLKMLEAGLAYLCGSSLGIDIAPRLAGSTAMTMKKYQTDYPNLNSPAFQDAANKSLEAFAGNPDCAGQAIYRTFFTLADTVPSSMQSRAFAVCCDASVVS